MAGDLTVSANNPLKSRLLSPVAFVEEMEGESWIQIQ